jgi:hypothetical protein
MVQNAWFREAAAEVAVTAACAPRDTRERGPLHARSRVIAIAIEARNHQGIACSGVREAWPDGSRTWRDTRA